MGYNVAIMWGPTDENNMYTGEVGFRSDGFLLPVPGNHISLNFPDEDDGDVSGYVVSVRHHYQRDSDGTNLRSWVFIIIEKDAVYRDGCMSLV